MENIFLEPEQVTEKILVLLQHHQRSFQNQGHCRHLNDADCFNDQRKKINELVQLDQPITFILPAFPAKSPNTEKTMGILPDLGERLALQLLNEICERIQIFYPAGARMVICSDGRVFSDLVRVPDDDVNAYAAGIKRMIAADHLTGLSTFSLDDCYQGISYDEMRDQVTQTFGEDLSLLKNRVKNQEDTQSLFNGIHRFIFEDRLVHFPEQSKNKTRDQSKEVAYQVIQRSNAWSRLLEKKFPDTIRLSIHPQSCGSEKLGVMLLESVDIWATPWHRVVLQEGDRYRLVKRKEAEFLKAQPIFQEDWFSHYKVEKC